MKKIPTMLLLAGSMTLAIPANAAFTLVEDFEDHTLGAALEDDANWGRQAGDGGGFQTGTIIADGGSQAARIQGGTGNATYYTGLGASTIADNTTGTLFFRFRTERAPWFQFLAYLSDWQPDSIEWWNNDAAGFYGRWNTPTGDGTALIPRWDQNPPITDVDGASWYNVWVVADNTADTFDLYLSQGTDAATGDATSVTAATGIAFGATGGDLDNLFFGDPDGNADDGGVVDDIYVDNTGVNLTYAIPEPTSALLLGLASLGLLARRHRVTPMSNDA